MSSEAPKLITVGVMADATGVTPNRIQRILQTRPHIRPVAYAGNVRLFTSTAIALVRHEINRIDARRAGQGEVARG